MNRGSCKGDIDTFLILARRGESEYKLRGIIDRAPVKEVTSWVDKDGLDLLHNVIIANNVEAVEYLLRHGFFVRPHVPETNPYSHLAALLGQRAMLQVLLQHRPDDFYPSNVPMKLSENVIETVSSSTEFYPDTQINLIGLDDVDYSSVSTSSSRIASAKSTRPSSSSTRPGSAATSSTRPGSGVISGKRPGSGATSTKRPESGTRSLTSPGSGIASGKRPESGTTSSTRPGSGVISGKRPGSGATSTKRPESGTTSSSRPGSGIASGKRPGSGTTSTKRPGSTSGKRPESGSTSSLRPGSGASSTKLKSSSTSSTSSSSSRHTPEIPKFFIESLSTFLSNVEQASSQPLSPLDVASRTGKLECVKVILNQCVLKLHAQDSVDGVAAQSSSDIALACAADSPRALALILHRGSSPDSDWEAAVEICLQHARAECLDILLSVSNTDTGHMFKSTNFFHVLFTSASMHGVKCYPRMALTTDVLIKHGHNVNAKMPCRTFPMYSLLTNAFCFRDYHNTKYFIQALRILLKHGANLNFDEVDFEKKHPRQAANKVIGRDAYSSALHCLMQTAERYAEDMDSPQLAIRFIEDCASVIMGSPNASMNVVGCVGDSKSGVQGNALHQLAKSSVTMGASAEIFRCLLRHGADPNVKVRDKYAINVYLDTLFNTLKEIKSSNNHFKTSGSSSSKRGHAHSNGHPDNFSLENVKTVLRLCSFMYPSAIGECLRLFLKDHGKDSSPTIAPYRELVKTNLETRSREVQSLVRASSWQVWKACGYRGNRVHALNISSELKTYILPMAF